MDSQTVQALKGTSEAKRLEEKDGRFFARKDAQQRCTFLTHQNQCELHARSKPAGCRQFPFRLVRTPDGIFVGASFYCPSIQANQGRPLEHFRGELQEMAERLPLYGAEGITVWRDCRLSWSDYLRLESHILANAEIPAGVAEGLWALAQYSLAPNRPLSHYLDASAAALEPPDEPLILMEHHWFERLMQHLQQKPKRGQAPSAELERYLRAVLQRKCLINRRPLLGNLALLHLVPRFYNHWWSEHGSVPKAIEECENKIVTHPNNLDDLVVRMGDDFREMDRLLED